MKKMLAIAIGLLVAFATLACSSNIDLESIVPIYLNAHHYQISPDGLSLEILTNPENRTTESRSRAIQAIREVNHELGLPDYVWTLMSSTRAMDGRQSEPFEGGTVSWIFHSDSGLEVLYMLDR
ncbi:MAG: hypothetical protein FWC86_04900 [Coriobacteriia bacterium]|nr:hypothetical protein [Coriobacteriia bacterium]